MLIDPSEFMRHADVIAQMYDGGVAFDFETTGFDPRNGAKAFLMSFAYGDVVHSILPDESFVPAMRRFFGNSNIYYAAHNAKFELGFLRHQFGIEVAGRIWDTEVFAKCEYNNHAHGKKAKGFYSLDKCAERLGMSKYNPMAEWLSKKGNKGMYHLAPMDIVVPYCEQDARLSYILMEHQRSVFKEWQNHSNVKPAKFIRLEQDTTKALFEMEDVGLYLDIPYCERALRYERDQAQAAEREFKRLTGQDLVDHHHTLKRIFDEEGIPYGWTEKGNASFTEDALLPYAGNPVVAALFQYRGANKRASTYWQNFLEMQVDGKIHPNIKQAQADTFRMSITNPACQTWPRDDDDSEAEPLPYPVRRAFLPKPGCYTLSMDYSQMELRLMVDESGEMGMVRAIMEGIDFHQEVANLAKVKRTLAKNGRFAKLYGAGVPRLASTLKVSEEIARRIADALDEQSPRISAYCRELINYAKTAPYGYNWLGRRFFFDPGMEYKYPNYRIQGGCTEILRYAIVEVTEFLRKNRKGETCIALPIHDELVFHWDPVDDRLLPEVRRIMIGAYKSKRFLDMDVGIESGTNFYDLTKVHIEENPTYEQTR